MSAKGKSIPSRSRVEHGGNYVGPHGSDVSHRNKRPNFGVKSPPVRFPGPRDRRGPAARNTMGVPHLALGLSAPAPSYLTTCDPFPTVAFHHVLCVLPVPLGDTPLPWGIMPGAFCPPHLALGATSPRSVLSRWRLLPALECVPLEGCLPSWGSAPSPLERMLPFT